MLCGECAWVTMPQLRNPLTTWCLNSSKDFEAKCKLWQSWQESDGKRGQLWRVQQVIAVLAVQSVGYTRRFKAIDPTTRLVLQPNRQLPFWPFVSWPQKTASSEWAIGQLFSRHTTDLSRSLSRSLRVSFALCTSQNKLPPQAELLIISHSALAERGEEGGRRRLTQRRRLAEIW